MKLLKMLGLVMLSFIAALTFSNHSFADTAGAAKNLLLEQQDLIYTAALSPILALNNYAGQYERKLFSTMVNSLEIAQDVTVLRRVKSKLQMTELDVKDALRPYNPTKQIRGTGEYKARVLEASLFKREEGIEIKKYHGSFLEEFFPEGEGSAATQKTIPFAQYFWDQVIKRMQAEINDSTAYFGFDKGDAVAFAPGDTYDPGDYVTYTSADGIEDYWKCVTTTTAGQDPEDTPAKWQRVNAEAVTPGFGYRIADDVTNSLITPTTIGEIDNSSVYAYAAFTELFRTLPEVYRNFGVTAYCSYTDFDFLLDDFEGSVGKYTENDKNWVNGRGIFLPKSGRKCLVLPCTWMSGSRRIIMTPKVNMLMGTDLENDQNKIKLEEELWQTLYGISGTLGFQIRDPKAMVINDQA